jgi:hypothetical protein
VGCLDTTRRFKPCLVERLRTCILDVVVPERHMHPIKESTMELKLDALLGSNQLQANRKRRHRRGKR